MFLDYIRMIYINFKFRLTIILINMSSNGSKVIMNNVRREVDHVREIEEIVEADQEME